MAEAGKRARGTERLDLGHGEDNLVRDGIPSAWVLNRAFKQKLRSADVDTNLRSDGKVRVSSLVRVPA